ncbi:MAG: right-handed parallel beta-helix repeat-containing protein [Candidatus Scalindua sp.]|nr:right-handed parallel beta-helix repeat-containing protein [Candidatus Scalindua sp.]
MKFKKGMPFLVFLFFFFVPVSAHSLTITNIETSNFPTELKFSVNYSSSVPVLYNPLTVGGFAIALFLDIDQNINTGISSYSKGREYYAGYSKTDNGGGTFSGLSDSLYVRNISTSYHGPVTGIIPINEGMSKLNFSIPLNVIGIDGGLVNFLIELYDTLFCPECGDRNGAWGISDAYAGVMPGTSVPTGDAAALIDAINTANSNNKDDTIYLQGGTYTLTKKDNDTNGPNGLPSVTSSITLKGTGTDSTIIQRDRDAPLFRIFHVADTGVLQIDSVTIKDGVVPDDEIETFDGGGIYNIGTVTIRNSSILHNEAHNGGGIANTGTITITDSSVRNNVTNGLRGSGGGIDNSGGTVIITNGSITNNIATIHNGGAGFGGGICNNRGSVTITDTTVSDNVAAESGFGGGILNYDGTITITNSILKNNRADSLAGTGGGILSRTFNDNTETNNRTEINDTEGKNTEMSMNRKIIHDLDIRFTFKAYREKIARTGPEFSPDVLMSTVSEDVSRSDIVTITNSTITDNNAITGGGIANWSGLMNIMNSTISLNDADSGGGIDNSGIVSVENSTIAHNVSAYWGVGINNSMGTVSITNSTISDNRGQGSAISNEIPYSSVGPQVAGTVELKNTILADNSAGGDPGDCEGPITSLGNNIIGDIGDPGNCTITLLESDSTGDPRLREFIDDGLPGHGHVPLLPDSPAIDAGNNPACPEKDQLGKSRPVDGNGDGTAACDIGAIEFEYPENSYIRSPRPGSRFTDPIATTTVKFEWIAGSAVSQHWLSVGTSLASLESIPYGDIYSRNQYLNTSATVSGIPLNGQDLYVRLWFKSSTWNYVDYTYKTLNNAECNNDSYEPNDTAVQAYGPLLPGKSYKSKLCDNNEDWYKIDVGSTGTITLDVKGQLSCNYSNVLELYDPGGVMVDSVQFNSCKTGILNYDVTTIGTYRIKVVGPVSWERDYELSGRWPEVFVKPPEMTSPIP